jgi:hypothetical protein
MYVPSNCSIVRTASRSAYAPEVLCRGNKGWNGDKPKTTHNRSGQHCSSRKERLYSMSVKLSYSPAILRATARPVCICRSFFLSICLSIRPSVHSSACLRKSPRLRTDVPKNEVPELAKYINALGTGKTIPQIR